MTSGSTSFSSIDGIGSNIHVVNSINHYTQPGAGRERYRLLCGT